jgi:hypothetical protein
MTLASVPPALGIMLAMWARCLWPVGPEPVRTFAVLDQSGNQRP